MPDAVIADRSAAEGGKPAGGVLTVISNERTDLPPGFARAAFELFLISEVHPYDDGNGRVARAAMGAELTVVDRRGS